MSGLNARLCSAAHFVRQDAVFADIGTDHAYLPVFLLESGRVRSAVCSDVNEGPLATARRNAARLGDGAPISFYLTDGAEGLSDLGITDYAICGMGGELIASIIERSPHLFDGRLRLILQPMSRQEHLRRYLTGRGFRIDAEHYSLDAGKYYTCLCVSYRGEPVAISEEEAYFGTDGTEFINNEARVGYIESKLKALKRAVSGKAIASDEPIWERRIISVGERMIAEIKKTCTGE